MIEWLIEWLIDWLFHLRHKAAFAFQDYFWQEKKQPIIIASLTVSCFPCSVSPSLPHQLSTCLDLICSIPACLLYSPISDSCNTSLSTYSTLSSSLLSACLPVCLCGYLPVSLSLFLHTRARTHTHTHTQKHTNTNAHTHAHICCFRLSSRLSVSFSVCMSVCLSVFVSLLPFLTVFNSTSSQPTHPFYSMLRGKHNYQTEFISKSLS